MKRGASAETAASELGVSGWSLTRWSRRVSVEKTSQLKAVEEYWPGLTLPDPRNPRKSRPTPRPSRGTPWSGSGRLSWSYRETVSRRAPASNSIRR